MSNNVPLIIVAILATTITAIASASAFDDETPLPTPEGAESPTATPEPEATPQETEAPTEAPDATPTEEEDSEDDEAAEEDAATEAEDPNKPAQALADTFGVPVEEVLALHEQGIGFGALFKLYKLALAMDMDVNDLIAEIEGEGGGWAFGKRFRELTDEEKERWEGLPRNLGQAISGGNHEDDTDTGEEAEATTEESSDDSQDAPKKNRGNSGEAHKKKSRR